MTSDPVTRHLTSDGLRLAWHEWGDPAAPALLLLHGMKDHGRSWDRTAQALQGRWRVVAPDLRGHGDSDWSPDGAYLAPFYLLDCVALVEALGVERLSIVAHSLGGSIAARYAALYPDRVDRLVLVDGFGPGPKIVAGWDAQGPVQRTRDWVAQRRDPRLGIPRPMAGVEEAADRLSAANKRLTREQALHLAQHGTRAAGGGVVWKYDPRVGMFAPEDFAVHPTAFWSAITAPTLILWPAKSWTTNPEEDGLAQRFPDRRTIVFGEAGHWLHHDHADAFVAALDEFL